MTSYQKKIWQKIKLILKDNQQDFANFLKSIKRGDTSIATKRYLAQKGLRITAINFSAISSSSGFRDYLRLIKKGNPSLIRKIERKKNNLRKKTHYNKTSQKNQNKTIIVLAWLAAIVLVCVVAIATYSAMLLSSL